MARKVTLAEIQRAVRAGAVIKRPPPVPTVTLEDVERLLNRRPVGLTVDQVLDLIPQPPPVPVVPSADEIARLAAGLIPPAPVHVVPTPDLDGMLDDVMYDDRDGLIIKLRSGRTIKLKIAGTTTVIEQVVQQGTGTGSGVESRYHIDSDEVVRIPEGRNMLLAGGLINDGVLINDGRLIEVLP